MSAAERCSKRGERDHGENATPSLLSMLDEVHLRLYELPSSRRQNYLLHAKLRELTKLIAEVDGGVCLAPAPADCLVPNEPRWP